MLLRDKLGKQQKFEEYKQQRNHDSYLVRKAKKKYIQDLAGNKADISSIWRAINKLTKDSSIINNNVPSELTPDVLNVHFVSVVSKFLPDGHSNGFLCSCSKLLIFCHDRTSKHNTFLYLHYLCLK